MVIGGLGSLWGTLVGGIVLGVAQSLGPIWLMLLPTGGYLWEYPAQDLFPLVLLAIVPAGGVAGFDRRLAPRFGHRWPF